MMLRTSALARRSSAIRFFSPKRCLSSSIPRDHDAPPFHQRVWKAEDNQSEAQYWTEPMSTHSDLPILLHTIETQELQGGRMAQRQLGVLREDPSEDMRLLMENYTVPSLASALRDREDILQQCAELCKSKHYDQVAQLLRPFQHEYVLNRRTESSKWDVHKELNSARLELIRRALMRMPRRVVHAHQKRAGVVLALCNVNGVPSLLLEKRAPDLRAHPDEVCLPGGMVCNVADSTIVNTCLREMREEIAGLPKDSTVLGVLRCNWGEVHHLVGVAVTPVVCFVGDLTDSVLEPNPSEVAQVFTIPLHSLMQRDQWVHREGFAPIFVGGPHVIWGLTGYILERFVKDILALFRSSP